MKDMERSLSRTEWREAATGGLYAGLAYALLTIAAHAGRSMPGLVTILNAVSFFSFAGFLYFYARRMAAYAAATGFPTAEPAFRTEDVAFRGRSGRCRPVRSGQLDRSRGIPRAVRSDGRQYGGRRYGRERGRNGRVARTQTDAQSAVRGVQRDFQHVDLRRPARFVDLDFCPASRPIRSEAERLPNSEGTGRPDEKAVGPFRRRHPAPNV